MFTVVWVRPDAHYGAYTTSWFPSYLYRADPRNSAVYSVCPKPLGCWKCGFKSRYRHGCVLCCVYCVLCTSYCGRA